MAGRAGHELAKEIDPGTNAQSRRETDLERVVVVGLPARQRIGIGHPDRFDVDGQPPRDPPGHHGADGRGVLLAEVVEPLDGDERINGHRHPGPLPDELALSEELNRLVVGPVDPDLGSFHQPEA